MTTLRTPPPTSDLPNPPAKASGPGQPAAIGLEVKSLRALTRLVAERAAAEAEVERTRASRAEAADRDYRERRQALLDRFEGTKAAQIREDAARRRAITDASIASEAAAKDEFARASRKIASEFDAAREKARGDHAKGRARALADFDSGEKQNSTQFATARKPIDDATQLIRSRQDRLATLFEDYRGFGLPEAPNLPTTSRGDRKAEDPLGKVFDRIQKLEPNLKLLEGLFIPKAMKGRGWLWIFVVLPILLVGPMIYLFQAQIGLAVTIGASAIGGYLLKVQLTKLARDQVAKFFYPTSQALVDCEALVREARGTAEDLFKAEKARVAAVRDEAMQKAKLKQARAIAEAETDRDERLRVINEVYAQRKVETQTPARPGHARGRRAARAADGRDPRPA